MNLSLTEQIIVNPVLTLRAPPLDTEENSLTKLEKISYFFQSEVITRVIAIATSFFAIIDSMAHLGIGVVKGAHLGLWKLGVRCMDPAASGEEIAHHFKHSIKFFGISLIGSIVSPLCPGVLKYFQVKPFYTKETSDVDWNNTSKTVKSLWNKVENKKNFEKLWENTHIKDRRIFVHLLDRDTSRKGQRAKVELIDVVYKRTAPPSHLWPKQKQRAVFYHATSLQGLEGILKSGVIEVRHEKAYRGAFVSTRPETGFGKYILVFNRNIERISHLNHGFGVENAYWAGFSHDIPVNANTLRDILIYEGEYDEPSMIEERCQFWSGRKINVKNIFSYEFILGDQAIPKEWPENDPNAHAIQETMKIRIKQQQALEVNQKHGAQRHRVLLAH